MLRPSLRRAVVRAIPLFAALALLMAGNGFHASLLGLRSQLEGFGTTVIGFVMSSYYAGFLAGSLLAPRLLNGVGHIRAFSGLASLASAAVLVHVVAPTPVAWALLRLVSGFCVSGLFVVTETWLNRAATNTTRGQLLGVYMVVLAGSVGVGQLLLNAADPAGFGAFVLASVLVSLAVVPVALVRVSTPEWTEPEPVSLREVAAVAPLAVIGAAASGATTGAVFAVGAVYAATAGLSVARTSVLLAAVLAAALVLQFPLGALSDRGDRRRVIAAVALLAGAAAAGASRLDGDAFALLVATASVAGGLGYPLYSLSNAHLNDYLTSAHVVGAGAKVVLLNGAGAVVGPLVASAALDVVGTSGFFSVLAAIYAVTGCYALYRLIRRAAAPAAQRATFAPVPAGAAPTSAALTTEGAADLYPTTEGVAPGAGGVSLHWSQRGHGPAVVLVHDEDEDSTSWGALPLHLAEDNHRVIAYDRRGRGRSTAGSSQGLAAHVADLESLLRAFDLASCHIVAAGEGGVVAAAFAADQPERVDSLVLVGASDAVAAAPAYVREGLASLADRTAWVRGEHAPPGRPEDLAVAGAGADLPHDAPEVLAEVVDDVIRTHSGHGADGRRGGRREQAGDRDIA